jgi:hypothetical protein
VLGKWASTLCVEEDISVYRVEKKPAVCNGLDA